MTNSTQYLSRLERFNDFYLTLVIVSATVCVGGIAIAIHLNLLAGVLTVLASAVLYAVLSITRTYSLLGLRLKSIRGTQHVCRADCVIDGSVFIPNRLMWADVTRIDDGALASDKNQELEFVYLPRGIEVIGKDVFGEHASRVTVLFEGDLSEWEKIEKHTDFELIPISYSVPFPKLSKAKRKNSSNEDINGGAKV